MSDYSGASNLEAMAEAVNYNAFLLKLTRRYAGDASQALDFGAGIGTFSRSVRHLGIGVCCVEPDTRQAELLAGDRFTVYRDINDTPPNEYDYVYSLNVLEHIEEDEAALRQIWERLKVGGKLFVYVPAFEALYSGMDRRVGHLRRYRKGELVARMTRAGFDVRHARYCDCLGYFASLAYKWIGDSSGQINVPALVAYDRLIFPLSRALDLIAAPFFGKNVLAVGVKR